MGVRNSSLTRVAPIFDALTSKDPTGGIWMERLLRLPQDGATTPRPSARGIGEIKVARWGRDEMKLQPPLCLLEWLVSNAELQPGTKLGTSLSTIEKRTALLNRDAKTIAEALAALRESGLAERVWYVFEGRSQPDAYIETPNLILVIEGKRTEAGATRRTTWMRIRDQMLRHIDCAWEIRGSRRVLGFMIVEGDESGDPCAVPPVWSTAVKEITTQPILTESLPHRTEDERRELASCFLGVVTWQRLCGEFSDLGISMNLLPDLCDG